MITTHQLDNKNKLNSSGDSGFGNILFRIASTIGIARQNGYEYAFPEWMHQEYFTNPLPILPSTFKPKIYEMKKNLYGADVGFSGFNIPDNVSIQGYLGSPKYFNHCKELIKHFFTLKKITEEIDDSIIIHYRDYHGGGHTAWQYLDESYYKKALEHFPTKRIVVVTDNILAAKRAINLDCEYISRSIIEDFYILAKAKYLIMANSTFSWWGAWLSDADTVAPSRWFTDNHINTKYIIPDVYLDKWTIL
jgi:hypothetical protein